MATNDEPPILYARGPDGSYLYIEDVPNGDACGCLCPACSQPMRARNRGLKRLHSFAHKPGATCTWAVEAVITELAKQAIEQAGQIALPALFYHNEVTNEEGSLSSSQLMRVTRVEEVSVTGRQPPCLTITIQGERSTAVFALCVFLRKGLSPEQAAELYAGTRGVILVNLGLELERRRTELDKHYDRDELLREFQDVAFLSDVLTDTDSGLASWKCNARRDMNEEQSRADKQRLDKRREEERIEREAELKRQAEERKRQEEERAAREAREGIVKEPDSFVTEADEYDVRNWPSANSMTGGDLTAGEALVRNGDLLALIVQKKERSSLFILTDRVPADMTLNAIDEVSWNREQLTRGFDKSALFLFSDRMGGRVEGGYDGDARDMAKMSLHTRGRAYCYALQGLVFHKMTVLINVPDGGVWRIERVDLGNETLSLRRWKK